MLADRARFLARAGRGGDGSISFRREKYVPRGGPDGGDGGRGGDIALVADAELRDLSSFRGRASFSARRGEHGRGANRHGANGADVVLRVPVGTQVRDPAGALVADLAHPGARVVLARGGRGGQGNRRFAGATRQAPRVAEPGLPGETVEVELRLKLVVDAALLGFPNAGKSSLLRRLSNAEPKVADYPFTTVSPVLGTAESADGRRLVVADVPGLLEGASEGVGLGDDFLAHLERARLLVHVIDVQGGDAEARFRAIDRELVAYGGGLAELPQIVVLNKSDLGRAPAFSLDDPRIRDVVRTSALTGEGVGELVQALLREIPEVEARADGSGMADFLVYRPSAAPRRRFRVLRGERGYLVTGRDLDGVPLEEIEQALREAGARTGDEVAVGERTLELA